jgi:hypothetical protein
MPSLRGDLLLLDRPHVLAAGTPGGGSVVRLGFAEVKEHIPWFDTTDEWTRYSEFPPGRAEELDALSGREIEG